MKTRFTRKILAVTILTAAQLTTASIAAAQAADEMSEGEFVVPLSNAGRPVVLEVSAVRGSVSVIGYDGSEVRVAPLEDPQRLAEDFARNSGGLRRIPNTSMGLTVEESDNTVSVRLTSGSEDSGVRVTVPRGTSVRARTVNDGNVVVEGVNGEHELSNTNGDVTASDISGSVVANTTNGDISVSMTDITPDRAMSFTSFNGDVEVRLPASLAADLYITTNRGDILTDFDVELLPQETIVERSADGGRYQVRLESEVRATVGGGGPEVRFKTFNGDIVIRSR